MAKACANMKPVNVASCDAHLTRNKAYMATIPKDERYTREDLAHLNEKWNFWLDRFGDLKFTNLSVKSYYFALCQFIKDKTGRTVGRARTMRDKRGRLKEYSSVTPLWDMVVLIKDDTTKEDVTKFVRAVQGRFHITPVMAAIHRDEGHYNDDGEWKPNLHAHIVWDRIRKDGERAGRVIKLEKQDVSEIQDMAATYLGLERGVSKKISNKRHLERDELIRKKQEDKLKEVAQMDGQIEQKRQEIDNLRLQESQAEARIAKLDGSNGNFVLNKIAKLFGKGDYDAKLAAADVAKAAAEAKAEQAIAEATQTKADAATAATNSDNVVSALRREIRQMESEHEKELADVKKTHKLEVEDIKRQHEGELKKKDYEMRKQVADSQTLADQLLARLFTLFPLLEKAARAIAWMANELARGWEHVSRGVYPRDYKAGIAILCLGQETNERRHTASRVLADMADARWNIHKSEGVVVSEWHEKILEQAYEETPRWALDKPLTSEEPTIETDETIEKLREVFADPLPKGFSLVQPQEEEKEEEQKRGGGLHR